MKEIILSDEIRRAAPGLKVLQIEAEVTNSPTPDALWDSLCRLEKSLAETLEVPDINRRPGISATRLAYKACGKDPNRYRPSNEQLTRRAVQRKGLYRLTALVDIINLLSLASGYSVGGFDLDAIEGDTLTLGIGRHEEPYHGIGRGLLNIEGMPVYRDNTGGVGTPTSDEERTKLTDQTQRLLMLVNMYGPDMPPAETEAMAAGLLREYAGATTIRTRIIG